MVHLVRFPVIEVIQRVSARREDRGRDAGEPERIRDPHDGLHARRHDPGDRHADSRHDAVQGPCELQETSHEDARYRAPRTKSLTIAGIEIETRRREAVIGTLIPSPLHLFRNPPVFATTRFPNGGISDV